jgi:hypothetical protein
MKNEPLKNELCAGIFVLATIFGTIGMGPLFFVSTSLNPIGSFIHETRNPTFI